MVTPLNPKHDEVEYTIIDEGSYTFELTKAREPRTEPNPFEPGKERTNVLLEWTCRDDEEFADETVFQFYTYSLGKEAYPSKLRPFVEALLGKKLTDDDDEDISLPTLEGRRITATLKHTRRQNGGIKMVLESPLAPRKKKKAVAPPPVEDEDEDGDDEGVFAP
jgi:hypothetical protein